MGGIRFMIVFGTGFITSYLHDFLGNPCGFHISGWIMIIPKSRIKSDWDHSTYKSGCTEAVMRSFQIHAKSKITWWRHFPLAFILNFNVQCSTWSTIWIPAALSKKNVIVLNAFPQNIFIFNQCNNQNHLEWIIVVLIIITIMLNTRDIGKHVLTMNKCACMDSFIITSSALRILQDRAQAGGSARVQQIGVDPEKIKELEHMITTTSTYKTTRVLRYFKTFEESFKYVYNWFVSGKGRPWLRETAIPHICQQPW